MERVSDLNDANQLKDLAPPSFLLIRKFTKNAKMTDIDEIISYLKSKYLTNNKDQVVFIQNFPRVELKIISKHIKDGKNMSLRNKALFGGWIAAASMVYKRDKLIQGKNLPQ